MKAILGIDPGLSGAIACLIGTTLEVYDIPSVKSAAKGRDVDWSEVARIVRDLRPHGIDHAFVERVSAMPGQGVSSMFKFGAVYGGLLGVLAANFIPVTLVTPQKWKAALGVPKAKDGARARASQLMPAHSAFWQRVKDDGRAEAALIAHYGAGTLKRATA